MTLIILINYDAMHDASCTVELKITSNVHYIKKWFSFQMNISVVIMEDFLHNTHTLNIFLSKCFHSKIVQCQVTHYFV